MEEDIKFPVIAEEDADLDVSEETYDAFQVSVAEFQKKKARMKRIERVELWALYQQVTEGDCTQPAPSWFKREQYAKWKRWGELEGTTMKEAIELFIDYMRVVGGGKKTRISV